MRVWSASTASARRQQVFSLSNYAPHDFARRRDVVDQGAGLSSNHGGNIKVSSLPCGRVIAPDRLRLRFQLVLSTKPVLDVMVAQYAACIRSGPPIPARDVEYDRTVCPPSAATMRRLASACPSASCEA